MAIAGELGASKLYIGPELPIRKDQSLLTLNSLDPFSGTLSCVGPAFFGAPTNVGFARAVVNIGPNIPGITGGFVSGIPLLALDVTGGTHHYGWMNNFAISNFFSISNTIGVNNRIGANNDIGFLNRLGYNTGIGGESNAQPVQSDFCPAKKSAAPVYRHYGMIMADEVMTSSGRTLSTRKGFDIKHPNKEGHRLRHICVEGPEAAVYVRGTVTKDGIIELPDYWRGLIKKETITVTLTPIGVYQELFVDRIECGQRVFIKNNAGGAINAYYTVWADRVGPELHVEYEGESAADYPDDQSEYSIAGYHYDVKE